MSVNVTRVSKSFQDILALDRVSIDCAPGEVLGVLGPNGAGKTTLLRILSGLLQPDEGMVEVAGNNALADPDQLRRTIGYVSADTGLYERLSPRETIRFFGRLHNMSDDLIRSRSAEIFKLLGIQDFADKKNGALSAGMKQKVSIARAIIHKPPVLIMDEPTAHLDVIAARAVTDFIAIARNEGTAVIYAGHNMDEAQRVCTRAVFIDHGISIGRGTIEELITDCPGGLNQVFFETLQAGPTIKAGINDV